MLANLTLYSCGILFVVLFCLASYTIASSYLDGQRDFQACINDAKRDPNITNQKPMTMIERMDRQHHTEDAAFYRACCWGGVAIDLMVLTGAWALVMIWRKKRLGYRLLWVPWCVGIAAGISAVAAMISGSAGAEENRIILMMVLCYAVVYAIMHISLCRLTHAEPYRRRLEVAQKSPPA